jgi:hypothetical protein
MSIDTITTQLKSININLNTTIDIQPLQSISNYDSFYKFKCSDTHYIRCEPGLLCLLNLYETSKQKLQQAIQQFFNTRKKKLCAHFIHNQCRFGAGCRFYHPNIMMSHNGGQNCTQWYTRNNCTMNPCPYKHYINDDRLTYIQSFVDIEIWNLCNKLRNFTAHYQSATLTPILTSESTSEHKKIKQQKIYRLHREIMYHILYFTVGFENTETILSKNTIKQMNKQIPYTVIQVYLKYKKNKIMNCLIKIFQIILQIGFI